MFAFHLSQQILHFPERQALSYMMKSPTRRYVPLFYIDLVNPFLLHEKWFDDRWMEVLRDQQKTTAETSTKEATMFFVFYLVKFHWEWNKKISLLGSIPVNKAWSTKIRLWISRFSVYYCDLERYRAYVQSQEQRRSKVLSPLPTTPMLHFQSHEEVEVFAGALRLCRKNDKRLSIYAPFRL